MKKRIKPIFSVLLTLLLVMGTALFSTVVMAENEKIDSSENILDLSFASIGS